MFVIQLLFSFWLSSLIVCDFQVSKASRQYMASDRNLVLSRPRRPPEDYKLARRLPTQVSDGARRYNALPRTLDLSKPNPRPSFTTAQFDSNAFKVKRRALHAQLSTRSRELSHPRLAPEKSSSNSSVFKVKRSALTGRVSARIQRLASVEGRAKTM